VNEMSVYLRSLRDWCYGVLISGGEKIFDIDGGKDFLKRD